MFSETLFIFMFTETLFEFTFAETFFNFMFTGLMSFGNPPFSRFLTKTAKICRYSQCLHSLITHFWDASFYLFKVLVLRMK